MKQMKFRIPTTYLYGVLKRYNKYIILKLRDWDWIYKLYSHEHKMVLEVTGHQIIEGVGVDVETLLRISKLRNKD